jgi:hypothetical protein
VSICVRSTCCIDVYWACSLMSRSTRLIRSALRRPRRLMRYVLVSTLSHATPGSNHLPPLQSKSKAAATASGDDDDE